MKVVADRVVRGYVETHGGAVYVWPRKVGCCRGRTFLLESATERPDRTFELVHAADGIQVFATPGLVEPEVLELEVSRRGRLQAYWNGQGWIG